MVERKPIRYRLLYCSISEYKKEWLPNFMQREQWLNWMPADRGDTTESDLNGDNSGDHPIKQERRRYFGRNLSWLCQEQIKAKTLEESTSIEVYLGSAKVYPLQLLRSLARRSI